MDKIRVAIDGPGGAGNLHRAILYGSHAGGALAHHSMCGSVFRNTDTERSNACDIRLIRALAALAEYDFVDDLGIDTAACEASI